MLLASLSGLDAHSGWRARRGPVAGGAGTPGDKNPLVTESLLLASADHGPARRSPARSAAARGEAQSAGVLTGSAVLCLR